MPVALPRAQCGIRRVSGHKNCASWRPHWGAPRRRPRVASASGQPGARTSTAPTSCKGPLIPPAGGPLRAVALLLSISLRSVLAAQP
jgi:hypothetical protein